MVGQKEWMLAENAVGRLAEVSAVLMGVMMDEHMAGQTDFQWVGSRDP